MATNRKLSRGARVQKILNTPASSPAPVRRPKHLKTVSRGIVSHHPSCFERDGRCACPCIDSDYFTGPDLAQVFASGWVGVLR